MHLRKKAQMIEMGDNFLEIISSIVLILVVGATALLLYTNLTGLAVLQNPNVLGALEFLNTYHTYVDWGLLLIFGGLVIGSIIRLTQIEINIVSYGLSWLIMIVFSFFFLIAGYVIQLLAEKSFFSAVLDKMIFLPFFADNSFIFVTLYFIICLITLHSPK